MFVEPFHKSCFCKCIARGVDSSCIWQSVNFLENHKSCLHHAFTGGAITNILSLDHSGYPPVRRRLPSRSLFPALPHQGHLKVGVVCLLLRNTILAHSAQGTES